MPLAEAITEIVDYAIFMLDATGHVLTWNKGARRIKGYEEHEIVGHYFSIFYPPQEVRTGKCERELEAASADGRIEDEGWRVRKDGTRFWANVVITAIRDQHGALQGFTKVTRDLTERVQAEENTRRLAEERAGRNAAELAQERLQFLADAGGELAKSLDHLSVLRKVAQLSVPRLADWTTVGVLDAQGQSRTVATFHRDPAKAELARAYETGFPPLQHPAGSTASGQALLIPVMSESRITALAHDSEHLRILKELGVSSLLRVPMIARGNVLGFISFIRSDSGQPYGPLDLALAQALGSRAALAVENARLYQEQHRQAELLRVALDSRDTFLSIASHELKTPLTPMMLRLEALARTTQTQTDSPYVLQIRTYLGTANRQLRKLASLVNDLLDVSRIAAGRMTLELEDTDLSELVREISSRFDCEDENRRPKISVSTPGTLWVKTARSRLDQVVTNLLDNAIKYGGEKPVQISVGTDQSEAFIRVQDEGIGIAPENLSRIFERFERAVSERNYGGLGLGLYISRTIVDSLGGRLQVKSEPERGATFTVWLPA